MSSLSSPTLFSPDYLLRFHARKLFLHIPLHQSNSKTNAPLTSNQHDKLDPYSGQSAFDANIIIVLYVLVCALLFSIGVNFIVKCALRCISSSENLSAQVENKGIDKKALKMFTSLKFSEGIKLSGFDSECAICLSEFKTGECVRVLPKCNHGFHVRCIDRWLGLHSTCPTCRNCIIGTCPKIVNSSQGGLQIPTPQTILSVTPLSPEGLLCNQTPQQGT